MKKIFTIVMALVCSLSLFAENPEHLFIVGDASPVRWNIGYGNSQTTMLDQVASGVYQWTGKLVVGDEGFKVSDNINGWGDWHPSEAGFLIDQAADVMRQGDPDTKWKVSEDGFYTVTINWETKEISAVKFTPDFLPNAEGVYEIGTAEEFAKFALYVSHAIAPQDAKAVLTADIDLADYPTVESVAVGRSYGYPYKGTFDGQGHTIKIAFTSSAFERSGLFAELNGATVKNLVVEGSVNSSTLNCVGGLGGRTRGDDCLIENVMVNVAVSYTGNNGDATCGGFFANMEDHAVVKNCAFNGSINSGTAEGNGCITGWAGGSNGIVIQNCFVAPTSYTKNGNSADYARNNPTVENCYSLASDDEILASGELCYLLNGESSEDVAWYQTLGTDATPVPFADHEVVYFADGKYYNVTAWTPEFDAEKVYTISNKIKTDGYWQDNSNGTTINCYPQNENSYWVIEAAQNKNCYYIKNAVTGRYVQAHGDATQVVIELGDTPAEYYIAYCEAEGAYGLASTNATVYDFTAGCVGLNLQKDPNEDGCCVQTFAAVAGTNHRSFWNITEAVMPAAAPAVLFTVDGVALEDGVEIDLAETKSINVNVKLPAGIEIDDDLVIEGYLYGKDGTNDHIAGWTDFEDGTDVSLSRLTPGNAYTIVITKIAYGEVIGMDEETWMPIYENQFEDEMGLATFNFAIKKDATPVENILGEPTIYTSDDFSTLYIEFAAPADVENPSLATAGVMINVNGAQYYGYGDEASAADGKIVLEIPFAHTMSMEDWSSYEPANGDELSITIIEPELYANYADGTWESVWAGNDIVCSFTIGSVTTGINSVATGAQVVKTIENGKIVILRNGAKYNVAGAQMK